MTSPMSPAPRSQNSDPDDESAYSTMDFIAEARRPLLIERHRKLIDEMESSLSDSLITGEADNPRLKAMLQDLEADSEKQRLERTLRALADDAHYKSMVLRAALTEQLCLWREEGNVEIAALQLHVMGIYRLIRTQVAQRQGEAPTLAELREMPTPMVERLMNRNTPTFGSPTLTESLVYTPSFADRSMRTIRRLRRAENADSNWSDANGEPTISREVEEPLDALPEAERKAARALLVRDRIRSHFYREVFLRYLSRDEFDISQDQHPSILHWLEAIENTPHLYPFMQGQTTSQKAFRLAHLAQKILQLHEIYARVALASQHPSYRDQLAGKSTRDALAFLSKDHYPPLALTPELTLSVLLCPFEKFVEWVQARVAEHDFVLPPDPKR
jgi:hypothetical protein